MMVVKWMLDDVNNVKLEGVTEEQVEAGRRARRQLLDLCELDAKRLRLVEIKLLSWLRDRSDCSLELNPDFPWCGDARAFVQATAGLDGLVVLHDERLVVSAELPADKRDDVLKAIRERYIPRVMT